MEIKCSQNKEFKSKHLKSLQDQLSKWLDQDYLQYQMKLNIL